MENKEVSVMPTTPKNQLMNLIDSDQIDSVAQQIQTINKFQTIVSSTLQKGKDFGEIPGTTKPTLLKAGAEKIFMLMGLTSKFDIVDKIEDYDKGFFQYQFKTTLIKDGMIITEGMGSANTRERKYVKGDPYDLQNTILKMAKKRSEVDAALTVASLSDLFTQDIEDMDLNHNEKAATMTDKEAANFKLTFGKYRDKTLSEVYKENAGYLNWLIQNSKKQDVKRAAELVVQQAKNPKTNTSNPDPNQNEQQATHESHSDIKEPINEAQKEQIKDLIFKISELRGIDAITVMQSYKAEHYQNFTNAQAERFIKKLEQDSKNEVPKEDMNQTELDGLEDPFQ
ncbi:hypothetical protein FHQ08_10295 [Lactobacillus sp. CC-MHH1034]|uniref:exodeoxyribonuclease X C-terminal domain-containing protein n=1 Tax=Agrilactobacillus fermenti TaxID=2586909 RepID=UPI001E3D8310|nr:hypothetical protein [Agrilactobacillus fermenti]MCD2257113.1 hypothetical protein [Agrilactobacillus fermenti]